MSVFTRSTLAATAVTLAIVAQPAAALAKSICVGELANQYTYLFSKVKLPKKPGETTTATVMQIFTAASTARTCTGSITRLTNLSLKVGLTCFGSAGAGASSVGWNAADDTLVGTAYYDFDGDQDFNDFNVALSPVDCEGLTIP